ncbi:MAG: type IV pilus modification protein PilV [Gallionellaceae bacterium]|nr:type IV pilus modification protein PilV [Gallionellaceae bacterium]
MKSSLEIRNIGWAKRSVPNMDGIHGCKLLGTLCFAQPTQCQFRQSGLTLLEIMITVVILSLGLLGLAGLQMTGLKNNRNAYYNTVAAQVGQDLAERIKADQTGAAGTGYDARSIDADKSKCAVSNPLFADRAACLAAALPGGQARVTKRTDTPKTFFVALRWTDLQLSGAKGWGADTAANPATTVCGEPVDNTSCYYTLIQP